VRRERVHSTVGELEREVRTVSAPCVLPHLTCMCLPRSSQMTRDDRMQKRKEMTTYASSSESSVKRLLATLLNSPSDSSLWFRPLLWLGAGGMSSLGSTWEMSLVADFLRLLRPLNSLDMRRREVSLRPSSELRLLSLSSAPSEDLRKSSLLSTETADESGPLEVDRPTGARLLLESSRALRALSRAAMTSQSSLRKCLYSCNRGIRPSAGPYVVDTCSRSGYAGFPAGVRCLVDYVGRAQGLRRSLL
jgi:hypothetical protein